MKILAINSTYYSKGTAFSKIPNPYTGGFYNGDKEFLADLNQVDSTRLLLKQLPNVEVAISYSEAIEKLKATNSYDLIITSFTPHVLLHPNDMYNLVYTKSKALLSKVHDYEFNGMSYYSAFFYLTELKKYSRTKKFIIYTNFGEPHSSILDFLNTELLNYEWVKKSKDKIQDKLIIKSKLFDLLSEYSLSLLDDGKFSLTQTLSRSELAIDFQNSDANLIAKPHFFLARDLDEIMSEFIDLINQKNISEEKIHKFLLAHPKFLLGNRYKSIRSKVQLQRIGQGPLIPDFILEPVNRFDFWKIVDLKLPNVNITTAQPNREGFNSQIMKALNQLSKYRSYFDDSTHRRKLSNIGVNAYKPILSVIIGLDYGKLEYQNVIDSKTPLNASNFEVVTFNDLLEQAKQFYSL